MEVEEREEWTDALVEIHKAAEGLFGLTAYKTPTQQENNGKSERTRRRLPPSSGCD